MAKIHCNVPRVNQSANCGSPCACTRLRGVCGAPISHLHRNHRKKHMGHILCSQTTRSTSSNMSQICVQSHCFHILPSPQTHGHWYEGCRNAPAGFHTNICSSLRPVISPKKKQARSEERAEHFCKESSPGCPSMIYTIIHNHAVTRHKQMQQRGVMTQLELDGRPYVEIFITPCS